MSEPLTLSEYYFKWLNIYKDQADDRLELLYELNSSRLGHGIRCPVCRKYPNRNEDIHADDCELAKELKDE